MRHQIEITLIRGDRGEAALVDCFEIRKQVFCVEQGVSHDLEWDGLDAGCDHILARRGGLPVGTARVRFYASGVGKIERVAVLKAERRTGVGAIIMAAALERLRGWGLGHAILNSQIAAREFYASLGFTTEGPEFMEADIPHVRMVLDLTRPPGAGP